MGAISNEGNRAESQDESRDNSDDDWDHPYFDYDAWYVKLVIHLSSALPWLKEICVLGDYPKVCRGIREEAGQPMRIIVEKDHLLATKFPIGCSQPFSLILEKVKILTIKD